MAIESLYNANDVDQLTFRPNTIQIYLKTKTLAYIKNEKNKYMEYSIEDEKIIEITNTKVISFEDLKTILKNALSDKLRIEYI